MRFLILILILLGLSFEAAFANVQVDDVNTANVFLKSKACRLQWVEKPKLGALTLEGTLQSELKIHCEHINSEKSAYLKLDGVVLRIGVNKVVIKGVILVKQEFDLIGDQLDRVPGVECKREGEFEFAKRGGRKFWRLQEPYMTNPCNQTTDYVDLMMN